MPMIQMDRSDDVDVIRALSVDTFAQTFADTNTKEDLDEYFANNLSRDELQREIDDPDSVFLVASVDGEPAGYMKTNIGAAQTEPMGDDSLEIQRLYILRDYKHHGLGTNLMHTAFDMARAQGKTRTWLGVWEHNDPAIAFYKRFGFTRCGSHTFVVGHDRQTDLLMQMPVPARG